MTRLSEGRWSKHQQLRHSDFYEFCYCLVPSGSLNKQKDYGNGENGTCLANRRHCTRWCNERNIVDISTASSYIMTIGGKFEPDEFHLPTVSSRLFGVDTVAEYALVYTWNTVALSLAVLGVFAIDLFIVGMYVEAASRLESIGDAFEKIADLENEQFGNEDTPERVDDFSTRTTNFSSIRRRVAKSVAEHNEIIKFVILFFNPCIAGSRDYFSVILRFIEELNDVFYWTLLFQSVFVGVIVAGCGFYGFVSFLHGNTSSFFRSMMYISGAICETWLCCTFGDRIKCSSANVATAMWNSHWYTLAVEDQRSVLLIMQASKNPLHMAAGKLFRMDLERLGFVLSSAYSYFTVLRNIYK
ncbi:putative odorant receptor 85e isoform X5 [Athalia rosae]|nr:putative odorant receptor 85e isoform X5 [Athalia rosae]